MSTHWPATLGSDLYLYHPIQKPTGTLWVSVSPIAVSNKTVHASAARKHIHAKKVRILDSLNIGFSHHSPLLKIVRARFQPCQKAFQSRTSFRAPHPREVFHGSRATNHRFSPINSSDLCANGKYSSAAVTAIAAPIPICSTAKNGASAHNSSSSSSAGKSLRNFPLSPR